MSELQHSSTERGRDREVKIMNPRVAGQYRSKGVEPVCLNCGTNLEGEDYHRKRATRQTKKIYCLPCARKLNMTGPECFGERPDEDPKCDQCELLVECSRETLLKEFPGIEVIGP